LGRPAQRSTDTGKLEKNKKNWPVSPFLQSKEVGYLSGGSKTSNMRGRRREATSTYSVPSTAGLPRDCRARCDVTALSHKKRAARGGAWFWQVKTLVEVKRSAMKRVVLPTQARCAAAHAQYRTAVASMRTRACPRMHPWARTRRAGSRGSGVVCVLMRSPAVCSNSLLVEHWGFDKDGAGASRARSRVCLCTPHACTCMHTHT